MKYQSIIIYIHSKLESSIQIVLTHFLYDFQIALKQALAMYMLRPIKELYQDSMY